MSIIKIKKLNVVYDWGRANETRALKDIDLEVYPGEFVIFFGPSGCGKSTLLYVIAGLETEFTGDVHIDDKDISQFSYAELEHFHQKKTGMIFQAYYLINSLSVIKNVVLPQIAIGEKKKNRKEKALKLMEHFGVLEQARKLPNELSGGQLQRVAICRALINDPDILLADEPIGSLDSKSAEDVMALLRNINEKQKKTIILVTHNPAYLNSADRVFYMKDGGIVDVKVNRAVNQAVVSTQKEADFSLSKELELLARTFSNISSSMGNLLIPFKAKQITAEVLTGMSEEEISGIENKVERLLTKGIQDNNTMLKYLDDEVERGGLGMDRRVAKNLANKIKNIVGEIKILEQEELSRANIAEDKKTTQVRRYLLDCFNVKIKEISVLEIVDRAIKMRLENKIDKKTFCEKLDLPIKEGGAGLDKRIAKKIAKRMELLMLGKYK